MLWWWGSSRPHPGVPVLDVGFVALTLALAAVCALLVRSLERR
ncbi:hypothetical protein AB1207_19405 [Kineococcus endophyticus]|uniref:Uncharacterized protein n=1 Tax=Kineococcus endophyticus TaxID=1181883 RepID=A0ABV3PCG9_9ACTN